jgi:hypothetical protein
MFTYDRTRKSQGGVEDAEEEEEEENDFLDILAGVDDDALPSVCNIENDQCDDLFGHQEDFLQNLRGGSRTSRIPTNNLWLNTPAANDAAAATVVAATVAATATTTTTTTEEDAAVPADDAEEDYSTTAENPGLNAGGGMAELVIHAKKLQHWKQKIEEMQVTSVEIKSKNQVAKWTVIEDVNPPISHCPPERQNLGIQDFDYNNIPRDEVFGHMFFHLMWIGID